MIGSRGRKAVGMKGWSGALETNGYSDNWRLGLTQKGGEAHGSPEPEHGIFHRISATRHRGHDRGGAGDGAGRGVVKGDDSRRSADGEKDLNMPLNISRLWVEECV
jgi:hypothetical protein